MPAEAATLAPSTPAAYAHWRLRARALLEPLAALMRPGRADLPLPGRPSDHDAQADHLESFARPLLLAALYLQTEPEADDAAATALREHLAAWFRAGLVLGSDPASPEYWGPDANYHQHHVEMGLMAIALQLAPDALWTPLSEADRRRVCEWFATARGGGIVNNNHLFMSVHILEFLGAVGEGRRTDRAVVDAHLDQLATMHRGGGWFEDGVNQAYDHYNAFAFHFYGLLWARLHGRRDQARAARWRGWARSFLNDYQHFFAASGEHPAFGRSITYRFNAIAPFALAVAENACDLPPGRVRRLCTRNLDFFLARPINDPATGCLAPGFTDIWPEMVESYSCPASPYWCAKGFVSLLLPPEHAYWNVAEEALPAESPRGFVRIMPRAVGLVARSLPDGEVELLNAGSMVSNFNIRYGAWKWSKLSYRTGAGFAYAFPEPTTWSADGALIAEFGDGRRIGRHSTTAIELGADHLGFVCNLGVKAGQANIGVETFVFWRAGWLLHVHLIEPRQPAAFRIGGFALPLNVSELDREQTADRLAAWSADGRGTVLQCVGAKGEAEWDERLDASRPRRHTHAPWHATPVFVFPRHERPLTLAALSWTGRDRAEAARWSALSLEAGAWRLGHPALGEWRIDHWALPRLSP